MPVSVHPVVGDQSSPSLGPIAPLHEPPMVKTLPFDRVTAELYPRAIFRSPLSAQEPVAGLNKVVWLLLLPPTIRIWPFGKYETPGQNISACTLASVAGLTMPVAGSKNDISVSLGVVPMSFSNVSGSLDPHIRTEPVGSIAAATGIIGAW